MNIDGGASGWVPRMKMGLGASNPPAGNVPAWSPPAHTWGNAPDICHGANCIVCPPVCRTDHFVNTIIYKLCQIEYLNVQFKLIEVYKEAFLN